MSWLDKVRGHGVVIDFMIDALLDKVRGHGVVIDFMIDVSFR